MEEAIAVLRELGYDPEPPATGDGPPTKWYDRASVDALSRVEADVIARRVVGKLRSRVDISADAAARLQNDVADALRRCFAERHGSTGEPPAHFRDQAIERATQAAREILDSTQVEQFVATLEADLSEDHTHDAGL